MAWINVAVIGGSALLGAYNANRQAKAQQKADEAGMLANAEAMRYSPWTGMKTEMRGPKGIDPTGSTIMGAMQGGLTGAMMGSQFKNLGGTGAPAPTPAQDVTAEEMVGNRYSLNPKPSMMKPY